LACQAGWRSGLTTRHSARSYSSRCGRPYVLAPRTHDHSRSRGEPPTHGVVSAAGEDAACFRAGQADTRLTANARPAATAYRSRQASRSVLRALCNSLTASLQFARVFHTCRRIGPVAQIVLKSYQQSVGRHGDRVRADCRVDRGRSHCGVHLGRY
jgi:hypothetical protein